MIWQDVVLAVGGFAFSVALIPSIRSSSKPARSSCIVTCGILAMFVVCYATLGLWFAAVSTFLTCVCWGILYVQQVRR